MKKYKQKMKSVKLWFDKLGYYFKKILRQPLKRRLVIAKNFIIKHPEISFFGSLGTLFVLILLGNLIRTPKPQMDIKEIPIKKVKTYTIGKTPTIMAEGKIEKTGVITIQAQVGGIINTVNVKEGQEITPSLNLITISSTYRGANPASLARQIAKANYDHLEATNPIQKEIIIKQKESAEKSEENNEKIREFTRLSKDEANSQLTLNEEILISLDENLKNLEEATSSAENDALILSTKQLKSQYLSAVNQLKSLTRSNDWTGTDDKIPATLSKLTKDILLKQLEIQEKALDLGLEISRLNLNLARINESLYFPSSPFSGVVEKIHVQPGEYINPGQALVSITASKQTAKVTVYTSSDIARKISMVEKSTLYPGFEAISLLPAYITKEAVNDRLHAVIFSLPLQYAETLKDGQYISVELPIGYPDTSNVIPYIPLEAIFQTQDEAFVYVLKDSTAQNIKVKLGTVFGRYIEITEGLDDNTQIILDRTVTQGSKVEKIDP